MKFYVYDVQKGKGYWKPECLGYTHDFTEAGLFEPSELPTHAGDCWIAIPQFIKYVYFGSGKEQAVGKPNLRVVEDLKRARGEEE